jgi:hypothetical protein
MDAPVSAWGFSEATISAATPLRVQVVEPRGAELEYYVYRTVIVCSF